MVDSFHNQLKDNLVPIDIWWDSSITPAKRIEPGKDGIQLDQGHIYNLAILLYLENPLTINFDRSAIELGIRAVLHNFGVNSVLTTGAFTAEYQRFLPVYPHQEILPQNLRFPAGSYLVPQQPLLFKDLHYNPTGQANLTIKIFPSTGVLTYVANITSLTQ
ncbi:MAG: hypothetical protein ABIJ34_05730 [archaeon]